jgi:hypothetical protein
MGSETKGINWNTLGSIAERIVRQLGRSLTRSARQTQSSGIASEPVKLDASDAVRAEQE